MSAHTKIGGAWRDVATIHCRVGGTWKEITEGHTKIGGTWKQFYANLVPLTVDYLVIAGGGGGHGFESGIEWGAGGSGGGFTDASLTASTSTNYTVTIGAGGSGGAVSSAGTVGGDSVFSGVTSNGGNGGAAAERLGGSGDGGNNAPIASTASPFDTMWGGLGEESSLSGTALKYAGGGSYGNANPGQYGEPADWGKNYGGGWAYESAGVEITPAVNRSGGGYGGYGSGQGGSNGGSGIVIIKYPDTYTITVGAGLTYDPPITDGAFKITVLKSGTGNVSWAA
jgi:hypothetical protein